MPQKGNYRTSEGYNVPRVANARGERTPKNSGSPFDSSTSSSGYNFLGDGFDDIRNMFAQLTKEGFGTSEQIGNLREYLAKSSRQGFKAANSALASRGMFNSGIGTALKGGIIENEQAQLAKGIQDILAQNNQYRVMGMQNLSNLAQFGANYKQRAQSLADNLSLNRDRLDQDWQMHLNTIALEREKMGNWWQELLGSLVGAGAQVGSAVIQASDVNVKDNIEQIGVTDEGIPKVKFNYKGDNVKYTGVIAQDVEKVVPEAVVSINGVKHVDYSKLSVNMEKAREQNV